MKKFIKWLEPAVKKAYPEPGSFNGLMLLFPPVWIKLIWIRLRMKEDE